MAVAGEAADTRMHPPQTDGPSRQPIGSPPSPPRASTKRRPTPASTTTPAAEVVATVELSDKAKVLSKTDVSGARKQAQDAITEALNPVAATKGIKALEEVADQTIILTRVVKESVLEHDTRISRAGQRLDVLEKRLAETRKRTSWPRPRWRPTVLRQSAISRRWWTRRTCGRQSWTRA